MLDKTLDGLNKLFASLEPRERRLIMIAAAVLLPALLFFAWFEPLLESRQNLHQRLERLESERAALQALSQQWRSLDQQVPAAKPQGLESRIKASLKASEGLESLNVKVLENGSVLVETLGVSQAKLLPWLVDVRLETQSQWAELRLERASPIDHLKLRIRFVEAMGQ